MKNFNELKRKLLQDKTVKKAYGDLAPQYALIEMIMRKRLKAGLSQETLAQKLGTKQSAIARFESGKTNPTLSFLTNITNALNGKLTISVK
ncbi:MAG: helix-turn-helix domain protein [Parcubacteria group bacterium]|nr:helix-turn-helix domain protein [Parcubacteria group bacterium]